MKLKFCGKDYATISSILDKLQYHEDQETYALLSKTIEKLVERDKTVLFDTTKFEFTETTCRTAAQSVETFNEERGIGYWLLGKICHDGIISREWNPELAFLYYEKSSNAGCAQGHLELGRWFQWGEERDIIRSLIFHKKSVRQKCIEALREMTNFYRLGKFEPMFALPRSFMLFSAAPKRKRELYDTYPIFNLLSAEFKENNLAMPKSFEQSIQFYESATNSGDGYAASTLGFCYELGLGVKPDLNEALKYYQLAFKMGIPCLHDLFTCHYELLEDKLMTKDEVIHFWKKLSENLLYKKDCFIFLAHLHEYGAPGIDVNFANAINYYNIAFSGTNGIDSVRKKLLLNKYPLYKKVIQESFLLLEKPIAPSVAGIISEYALEKMKQPDI